MNQIKFIFIAFVILLSLKVQAQFDLSSPKISTRLAEKILENPNQNMDVIIVLADKVDVETLRKSFDDNQTSIPVRTETTIRLLKQKANATQPLLISSLANFGVSPEHIQRYWIVNMLKVKMNLTNVIALTGLDEISYLDINGLLELDEFTTELCEEKSEGFTVVNGIEPGLAAINAPAMWALGYTGFGTKALSIDTGVEETHPAIANNYEGLYSGNNLAWFDFSGGTDTPNDCNGHGTHTVGTMLGLDRATNDTIGVAFDATWMGSKAICGFGSADNMASFQWAIDPDGDSTTTSDMPTVICNSWQDPSAANSQCGGMYQSLFDALEAVGVAVVFSAGNAGPTASTITPPKNINNDLVSVFCVGAMNVNSVNTTIAGFSSRGPSTCGDTGSYLIKPEVAAPGEGIRSADLGGIYSQKSGTSMAAPHVSGAILLLKQAFPYLTGRDLKLALYYSAIDLGDPGEDNTYGMGMIDVFAAYQYLVNQGHIPANPYVNRDLAAQNLQLSEIICDANLTVSPTVEMVNLGIDTVFQAVIRYTLSTGISDTVHWNGMAAQGDTFIVSLGAISLSGGFYDFEVQPELINGQSDERVVNNKQFQSFLLTASQEVSTQNTTTCQGSDALLYASHPSTTGEIRWYTQSELGTDISMGNSFTIPNLQSDITYYADVIEGATTGMTDNTLGAGYESNDLNAFLEFDCFTPFVLKTVKVYTNTTSGRKIILSDNFGNVIAQKLLNIQQTGEYTIALNWRIPRGENFKLGVDLASNYYVNTDGATYPYIVSDVLSIKGSNIGQAAYPFFYDWQIEYGSPCGRIPATAFVSSGTLDTRFSISADTVDLQLNTQVTFTDSTQNAVSWFWDFGDGNTSNVQNPTHNYTQPGEYKVYLNTTNSNGCSDATSKTLTAINFPVSTIQVDENKAHIHLYPNPTYDYVNIELRNDFQPYYLTVVNSVGLVVQSRSLFTTSNVQLNMTDYPKGIYFLQFEIGSQRVIKKVIRY